MPPIWKHSYYDKISFIFRKEAGFEKSTTKNLETFHHLIWQILILATLSWIVYRLRCNIFSGTLVPKLWQLYQVALVGSSGPASQILPFTSKKQQLVLEALKIKKTPTRCAPARGRIGVITPFIAGGWADNWKKTRWFWRLPKQKILRAEIESTQTTSILLVLHDLFNSQMLVLCYLPETILLLKRVPNLGWYSLGPCCLPLDKIWQNSPVPPAAQHFEWVIWVVNSKEAKAKMNFGFYTYGPI